MKKQLTPKEARVLAWAKRRRMMRDLQREGWTLERIAAKYNISKQAVWSCLQYGDPQ